VALLLLEVLRYCLVKSLSVVVQMTDCHSIKCDWRDDAVSSIYDWLRFRKRMSPWRRHWGLNSYTIYYILISVSLLLQFYLVRFKVLYIYLTVQVLKQLGIGAQGCTYLVKRVDNNQLFALKMVLH